MRGVTNGNNPWDNRPRQPRQASRIGVFVWIAVIVGGLVLLWQLSRLFPNNNNDGFSDVYLVRNVALLALVSSGLIYVRQFDFGETVRNIALWVVIAAGLLTAYAYKDEIRDAARRVRAELVPSYAVQQDSHTVVIAQSEGGGYEVRGAVNGQTVTFAIDTGASDIVLSPADAQRIGIDPSSLKYDRFYETANGGGQGATLTVASLAIGSIELHDVKVSINRAPMSRSLLGMAFLRRLKSFEFRGRRLYLTSR
jgi:aspartyl protease family protein